MLAHPGAVPFQFQNMKAAFQNIVRQLATHGRHGIEAAGLALIQNEFVDQRFQHQQTLEILGICQLRVIAGVVKHTAAHGVFQKIIGQLQLGKLLGIAAAVRVGTLGHLAIGGLDCRLVRIALHTQQNIRIDHRNTCTRILENSPARKSEQWPPRDHTKFCAPKAPLCRGFERKTTMTPLRLQPQLAITRKFVQHMASANLHITNMWRTIDSQFAKQSSRPGYTLVSRGYSVLPKSRVL